MVCLFCYNLGVFQRRFSSFYPSHEGGIALN